MRMRPVWLLGLLLLAAGWWLQAEWLFVKRYGSYLLGGHDAHTVPIEWFEPLAPLAHGDGWVPPPAVPPTIPRALLDEIIAYADAQDSMALIILRHGRLELEHYAPGYTRESLFNPQSMAKTLVAMAAGIALADGAFGSIDDPIGRYLDEWRDDPRGTITIGQLLQMSGGLEQISTDYRPVPWSRAVWQHFGTDFNAPILRLRLADPPGTRFDYNNNENNLLGLVLERATGEPYQDYLGRRLWQPAGRAPAWMYLDRPGGNVMKSCCIFSRPVDWAVLGQLLLDDGRLRGRQILPPGWVAEMRQPADTWPGYGYQLWLTTLLDGRASPRPPASVQAWWASEPFASDDVFHLAGHGFQHSWVIPSLDLVIVRASRSWPPAPWDQAKIPNLLIRGLRAN